MIFIHLENDIFVFLDITLLREGLGRTKILYTIITIYFKNIYIKNV